MFVYEKITDVLNAEWKQSHQISTQLVGVMLPPPPFASHTAGRVFQPIPPPSLPPPGADTVGESSQQPPEPQPQVPILRPVAEILSLNKIVYLGCRLHRQTAYLRDIYHLRDLVASHEALRATVRPRIMRYAYPVCSGCEEYVRRRDVTRQVPRLNALWLATFLEKQINGPQIPRQIEAHGRFLALLNDRSPTGLLCRLGSIDARKVSKTEYIYLLDALVDMFMTPVKMKLTFDFLPELEPEKPPNRLLGQCRRTIENGRQRVEVRMSAIRISNGLVAPTGSVLNPTSMARLSILLHEICHAVLMVYACQNCPGYTADVVQLRGHAFAWQRVAFAVEYAAWKKLGLKLRLGRFSSIVAHWQDLREWPSMQEFERWMLFWENL